MIGIRVWQCLGLIRTLGLILLMLTGCGGSSGGTSTRLEQSSSSLVLQLTMPTQAGPGSVSRTAVPGQTRQTNARFLSITVTGPNNFTRTVTCAIPGPATDQCNITETPTAFIIEVTVENVPRGIDLMVSVSVLDRDRVEIFHGDAPVRVPPTQPTVLVPIELTPVIGTNTAPRADAGMDQTVAVGETVFLRGDDSTDINGNLLSFTWSFLSTPPGSAATLSDATAVNPSFVVDLPGDYMLSLTVRDGLQNSQPDVVIISTVNSAPVADAGSDQTVAVGGTATLSGADSSDVDGDRLHFTWRLVSQPAGSTAVLSNPNAVTPSFVVDVPGDYVVGLIVNDGTMASAPDTVTVSTVNSAPVADAGPDFTVPVGTTVTLDGSGFDADPGTLLTFTWDLIVSPTGSNATLVGDNTVMPSFVVDVPGTYVVQLIVNDGTADSEPDTVTITTGNSFPEAEADPPFQVAFPRQVVMLDGSGSFDADGDPLSFFWSLIAIPPNSTARLDNPASMTPTFVADRPGDYVAQLIVFDGLRSSEPDTALITVPQIVGPARIRLALVGASNNVLMAGTTATLLVTLPSPAPTDVTVTVTSDNPAVLAVTPPGMVSIAAGATTGQVTLNVLTPGFTTVRANAPGFDEGTLNISVVLFSLPTSLNIGPGQTMSIPVTITTPAPPGGVAVMLGSNDPSVQFVDPLTGALSSTFSVTIPAGAISANALVRGVAMGTVTITGSTGGVTVDNTQVTASGNLNIVQMSPVDLHSSLPGFIVVQLESANRAFAAPAPITVNLTAADPGCVAVPASVTIPAGFVNVRVGLMYGGTAALPCTTTVTASDTNLQSDTVTARVNPQPGITLFGLPTTVGAGLQVNFMGARLGTANHGGRTLRVMSSDPTIARVSPDSSTPGGAFTDIFIPNGQTDAFYTIQGVASGTVTLTASAPGFSNSTPGMVTVVQPGLLLQLLGLLPSISALAADTPFQVFVGIPDATNSSLTQFQEVSAAGSLTATITNSDSAVARLVTMASTGQMVMVPIKGGESGSPSSVASGGVAFDPLAVGASPTTVSATIPGFIATTAATQAVTVAMPDITVFAPFVTVGAGLQTGPFTVQLNGASHGGVTLRLTSSDATRALVSPNATTPGSAFIDLPIANGSTDATYFVQGVEGTTGMVTLTASAPGFTNGMGMVTVVQPALELGGLPASITALAADDPFQVFVGIPDAGNSLLIQRQAVRAGHTTAPLMATIMNSDSTVAQLVTTASTGQTVMVLIAVGEDRSPATGVAFDPLAVGSTMVSATILGFIPTTAATMTVTDTTPGITLFNLPTTVGTGLQTGPFTARLNGANHGGVTLRLTSSNPAVALVSPNRTTPGAVSPPFIDLFIPNGSTDATYFVQGVEGTTGMVTLTASAPGFTDGTGMVTVVQPGVQISGLPTNITTLTPNDLFQVLVGIPSVGNTFLTQIQEVRAGGSSLTATVTNSDSTVGQLVTMAGTGQTVMVAIAPMQSSASLAFDPLTTGTTTVSATVPGLITTAAATVMLTDATPGIQLFGTFPCFPPLVVGAGLQEGACRARLGASNHGGVTLRLASSNPAVARVSPDSVTPGSAFIDLTIPNGSTDAFFFVQGVEGAMGSVAIMASAPGFIDGIDIVTVVPPGLEIGSLPPSIARTAPDFPFTVFIGTPDPDGPGLSDIQAIRAGGNALTVTITNSNSTAAQLVTTAVTGQSVPVTIAVGQFSSPFNVATGGVAFDPLMPGVTTVNATGSGFIATPDAMRRVTVTP